MMLLIVGLVIFLGVHLLPTSPEIRNGISRRLGAKLYGIVFSLLSLLGLVVIVLGYHKMQLHPGKNRILWDPPLWTHHASALLMLPAIILLVASVVPSRLRTAVVHPMLIGIMLWALAHLLANGDMASLLLFGSFLAFAIYDFVSVRQRGLPAKAPPSSVLSDVLVVAVGGALYAWLLIAGHAWLIGVAPIPELQGG